MVIGCGELRWWEKEVEDWSWLQEVEDNGDTQRWRTGVIGRGGDVLPW